MPRCSGAWADGCVADATPGCGSERDAVELGHDAQVGWVVQRVWHLMSCAVVVGTGIVELFRDTCTVWCEGTPCTRLHK
eukprot:1140319-Pelagomonas_calceolata.AAC.1